MSGFRKCCVCEGNLVDGRCVECGMRIRYISKDINLNGNTKWDYKAMPKSVAKPMGKPMEKPRSQSVSNTSGQRPARGADRVDPYELNGRRYNQEDKVKNKRFLVIIIVIIIITTIVPFIQEAVADYKAQENIKQVEDLGEWFSE